MSIINPAAYPWEKDEQRFFQITGIKDVEQIQRLKRTFEKTFYEEKEVTKFPLNPVIQQNLLQTHHIKTLTQLHDLLGDQHYVEMITQAWSTHVLARTELDTNLDLLLRNWILHASPFFPLGPILLDHFEDYFVKGGAIYELQKEEKDYQTSLEISRKALTDKKIIQALYAFLEQVSGYPAPRVHKSLPGRRIAILTDRSGGGHLTQVRALEPFFKSQGWHVEVIHYKDLEQDDDPYVMHGLKFEDGVPMSTNELYNKWVAHDKEVILSVMLDIWKKQEEREFPDLYQHNNCQRLMEKLAEDQIDIVLSTINYHRDLISIAYRMGIPFLSLHCDYVFSGGSLAPYLMQKHIPEKYHLITWGIVHPELPFIYPEVDINHPSIAVTGYPIPEQFQPHYTSQGLAEIRKKWNIEPNSLVYVISRGLLGVTEHLVAAVDKFYASKVKWKGPQIEIVVVCGENKEAKQLLEKKTKESSFKFHITGLLDKEKMAELFTIADVNDFKAGGGTTQEFVVSVGESGTKKFGVAVPQYGGEEWNAQFLENQGIGKKFDPKDPNPPDILEVLQQYLKEKKLRKTSIVNWKTQFVATINRLIKK